MEKKTCLIQQMKDIKKLEFSYRHRIKATETPAVGIPFHFFAIHPPPCLLLFPDRFGKVDILEDTKFEFIFLLVYTSSCYREQIT
jgi:hypothetical protein